MMQNGKVTEAVTVKAGCPEQSDILAEYKLDSATYSLRSGQVGWVRGAGRRQGEKF